MKNFTCCCHFLIFFLRITFINKIIKLVLVKGSKGSCRGGGGGGNFNRKGAKRQHPPGALVPCTRDSKVYLGQYNQKNLVL